MNLNNKKDSFPGISSFKKVKSIEKLNYRNNGNIDKKFNNNNNDSQNNKLFSTSNNFKK